jgi:phosphotransferase system  glucose/maltose/N-acetylglucosamine-specific IIC component
MQADDHNNSETTALRATGAFVTVHPGRVVMYQVTEQDLDFFASGMRSVFTELASSCVTVAISVSLLLALNSGINQQLEVGMLSTAIATALAGLVFGGLAVKEFWSYRRKLKDFKQNAARRTSAL